MRGSVRAALALAASLALAAPGALVAAQTPAGSGASQPEAAEPAAALAELVERLSAASDAEVAPLVARLEGWPQQVAPELGSAMSDALFLAARACEERLLAPARALALYERILTQHPDARAAVAAQRRAEHLRGFVGQRGSSDDEANRFAHLVAESEALPLAEALRRADALAARPWGGAAEVLLWSAELARRRGLAPADTSRQTDARGDLREAIARYRAVLERFPATPEAELALRGLSGAAADARDWSLAEQTARRLVVRSAADEITRDELLARAATGRAADRWAVRAYAVLAVAVLLLLASLWQVLGFRVRRGAWRALRPPIELAYMAPISAVLYGAALTAHTSIAPAVGLISGGGLVLAWLSGAALTEARARGVDHRGRTAAHVVLGAIAALALAYLAIVRTGLLDLLLATIRLGPEL